MKRWDFEIGGLAFVALLGVAIVLAGIGLAGNVLRVLGLQ